MGETRSNYLTVGYEKNKIEPKRPSRLFANSSMVTPAPGAEDSELKRRRAANLHQSMIMRSATRKWKKGDGEDTHLSYEKMKAVVLLRHPYEVVDGQPR